MRQIAVFASNFALTDFVSFAEDVAPLEICMIELDDEKVRAFTYAVKNNYWYQMYIDGLPIWGRVGDFRGDGADKKPYIFTHKKFEIGYNGNRIVDVKLTTERREPLVTGSKIKFTYEVSFVPSTVTFEDRFNKYLDPTFFQHRVWPRRIPFARSATDHCFFSPTLARSPDRFTGSAFSTVS